MTLTIPAWALWTLGVAAGLCVLALAAVGLIVVCTWKPPRW